jgi:PleD family two-component response regulator
VLIEEADQLLYRAKAEGRNRSCTEYRGAILVGS